MKKKIIIILAILIVLLGILLVVFLINRNKPVPFVKKYDIKVTSAKKEYTNPAYPYSKNADTGDFLNTDKIKFIDKDIKSHYKFKNLKKEKNDFLDKITFDIEIETPIKYTSTYTDGAWTYTYSAVDPILFDYYTGETYRVGIDVEDNSLIGVGINNENSNMKYTTIEWDGKEYKIGILKQYNAKWIGKKVNKDKNGTKVYSDKNIGTATIKIDAPKGYDGLMIAILKKGSTKESFELNNNRYEEYERLYNEYQNTGTKSEELKKIEEENDKVISLFDSYVDKSIKYNKDDFYVIRVNKIPKAK